MRISWVVLGWALVGCGVGSVEGSQANSPPEAAADSATTSEDTAVDLDVLANDGDRDEDLLVIFELGAPASGTATLLGGGLVRYTPDPDFEGSDTFTYVVTDGRPATAQGTVTVTVTPVNDAPAVTDDAVVVSEDVSLSVAAPGVLANDADVEASTLSATLLTQAAHGTVTLSADGSFTYVPEPDYAGTDSFTYTTSDGELTSAAATVTLTFVPEDDAPRAADDGYTLDEDGRLELASTAGVLANDLDADGDPLTLSLVTAPGKGELTLLADGALVYSPAPDANGLDFFTYGITDGTSDAFATVVLTVTPVNDAPRSDEQTYAAVEDTALSLGALEGVLAGDVDADGDALAAQVVMPPSHGTLSLASDGSFTYTPDADYSGFDSFFYAASDGAQSSTPAAVGLFIAAADDPGNDPPSAAPDAYELAEDAALRLSAPGVLANDSDTDGDALTVSLVDDVLFGTLALDADGAFTYTPDPDFAGADAFTYQLSDGLLASEVVTVELTVSAANDAPRPLADAYVLVEDGALTVPASTGVLANDTDVEDQPLVASLETDVAHGTLTLALDGGFTYVPDADFSGADTFTYRAADGGELSAAVTVTLTITPGDDAGNDPPDALPDTYAAVEDTILSVDAASGALANDGDIDGDALSAALVAGVAHGTLTFAADGSFSYTPLPDYFGADSFTYRAGDGSLDSGVVTVTLEVEPVNDAPSAAGDAYTTDEDTELEVSASGLLANDQDLDSTALAIVLVTPPAQGALALGEGGAFTYTPGGDFNGADSFTYRVSDGALESSEVTVGLTVNPVNDAPVASGESYTFDEDEAGTVGFTEGVLANDSDVESTALTVSLVGDVSYGTLTLSSDGSFTYAPDPDYFGDDSFSYVTYDEQGIASAPAEALLTIAPINDAPVGAAESYGLAEDSVFSVDAAAGVLANDSDADGDGLTPVVLTEPSSGTLALFADGSFVYVPAPDFNGGDSFAYAASDGTGDSGPIVVTLTVTPANDAPVGGADAYVATEDTTLAVVQSSGVLANDDDLDGDAITASLLSGVSHGTLTLSGNGSFTYAPVANYNGPDAFTYRVLDGSLSSSAITVSLRVEPVNDAPLAAGEAYTLDEDLALATGSLLANDSDPEGQSLLAILVSPPATGTLTLALDGSFSYVPAPDVNGSASFTYRASDGQASSAPATVSLTINPVNDRPVAGDDAFVLAEDQSFTAPAGSLLANDSDVEGPLSALMGLGPDTGALLAFNADGSFTYRPPADFNGTASFSYAASDGQLNTTATVTLEVQPVNDAPVGAADAYSLDEDGELSIDPGVLANDGDIDSTALTAVLVAAPAHGDLLLEPSGRFGYKPEADYSGPDSFTYSVSDGALSSAPVTVTLTIAPVNDAPQVDDDAFATSEDTPLTIAVPGVLANDSDADGPTSPSATLVSGPSNGSLTLDGSGSFTYAPNANFVGQDSFTYRASDGAASSDVATVTLTVNGVNDAPVASADTYAVTEDSPRTVAATAGVLGNDSDLDGDSLRAELVATVSSGTLALSSDGSFVYVPAPNFNGAVSFTYRARDAALASSSVTVTLNVSAVNDAPTAVADSATTQEDTAVEIDARLNDSDVDGDAISIVGLNTAGISGTAMLTATNTIVYTPAPNFSGSESFSYALSDGVAPAVSGSVTVSVSAVNDPPVAVDDTALAPGGVPADIDVLANDTDLDTASLTILAAYGAAFGTVSVNATGKVTYQQTTPATACSDSFTYIVSDGTSIDSATVLVNLGFAGAGGPVYVALASRPASGALVSMEEAFVPPLAWLSPALFVFDDCDYDPSTTTVSVDYDGAALVEGTHYTIDRTGVSQGLAVTIDYASLGTYPQEGAGLVFFLSNIEDTAGNAGSDVLVAVVLDTVAPAPTWLDTHFGSNSRAIIQWNEPMDPTSESAFVFATTSGIAVEVEPDDGVAYRGSGFLSLENADDTYFFVPRYLLVTGETYMISAAGLTDLAGNPSDGPDPDDERLGFQVCCTGPAASLKLLKVELVDRATSAVDFTIDAASLVDDAFVVPSSLVGKDDDVLFYFSDSVLVTSSFTSLREQNLTGGGAETSGSFESSTTSDPSLTDVVRFALADTDPSFVYDARERFSAWFGLQTSSGGWFSGSIRFAVRNDVAETVDPSIVALAGRRSSTAGAGDVPIIRPEETLLIAFSEPLDETTVHTGNIRVLDSSGGGVAIEVRADSEDAPIVRLRAAIGPNSPYPAFQPGTYTLSVTGVADLASPANAIDTALARTFVVASDSAAPMPSFIGSSPADGDDLLIPWAPVYLAFDDTMSSSRFSDTAQTRGFRLEEALVTTSGTYFLPLKGLAPRNDDWRLEEHEIVRLAGSDSSVFLDGMTYRLSVLPNVANIDGAMLDPSGAPAVITFSVAPAGTGTHRPYYETFELRLQQNNNFAFTFLGQPVTTEATARVRFQDWDFADTFTFTLAAPATTQSKSAAVFPSSDFELSLTEAETSAFFVAGTQNALSWTIEDSTTLGATVDTKSYFYSSATMTAAAPTVVTVGTGVYRFSGSVSDTADAVATATVGIYVILIDESSDPDDAVGLVYAGVAQIFRSSGGVFTYSHTMASDMALPAAPAGYVYRAIAALRAPAGRAASSDITEAISDVSAPFF